MWNVRLVNCLDRLLNGPFVWEHLDTVSDHLAHKQTKQGVRLGRHLNSCKLFISVSHLNAAMIPIIPATIAGKNKPPRISSAISIINVWLSSCFSLGGLAFICSLITNWWLKSRWNCLHHHLGRVLWRSNIETLLFCFVSLQIANLTFFVLCEIMEWSFPQGILLVYNACRWILPFKSHLVPGILRECIFGR